MVSSVISRLNDRRDAAADLGEDAGFTLIELMVVLLILAILLAIAIPTFLGVTGGANDRAAQSNLNTALTATKTQATQAGQSYSGITTTLMNTAEPSINWNLGGTSIKTQGPVSFYVDPTNGNGIVLTSYSKSTQTCWYVVDNMAAVTPPATPAGPYVSASSNGSATSAPTNAGTFYSEVTKATGCDAASVPTFVVNTTTANGTVGEWASNFTNVGK